MPHTALQAEVWFQTRSASAFGNTRINQSMYLLAMQHWLTSRLWLKAGLGFSTVGTRRPVQDDSDDVEHLNNGIAVVGAAGFEVLQAGVYALDVQFRVGSGLYPRNSNNNGGVLTTGVVAVGNTWHF